MPSKNQYTAFSNLLLHSSMPPAPSPAKTMKAQPRRILIVEDDPDHREILKTLLGSLGYVCHEAANGHEGIDELNRTIFDLVITDYQMPEMNGIQFIQQVRIRTTHIHSTIPIIFMTGHADPGVIEHALSVGATSALAKPYSLEALRTALTRIWALKQKP